MTWKIIFFTGRPHPIPAIVGEGIIKIASNFLLPSLLLLSLLARGKKGDSLVGNHIYPRFY